LAHRWANACRISLPDQNGKVWTLRSIMGPASVGLLERVAQSRGLEFDVHQGNTASWYSSRRVGETHSGFKVLVEKLSGRILGAHVLGPAPMT
jgi:glutathione reductase (NADPH)